MSEQSSKQGSAESSSAWWYRAARAAGATIKLFLGGPLQIVAVLSLVLLTWHLCSNQPVVLPIDVIEDLRKNGYTESAVARQLIGKMSDISQDAADHMAESLAQAVAADDDRAEPRDAAIDPESCALTPGDSSSGSVSAATGFGSQLNDPDHLNHYPNRPSFGEGIRSNRDWNEALQLDKTDITMPGTGTSLDIVATDIRNLLGWPDRRVTGEMIKTGQQLQLRLHLGNWSGSFSQVMESDTLPESLDAAVDGLLSQAAAGLMEELHPHIAASFQLKQKHYDRAVELIAKTLEQKPVDDDVWAYLLWAQLDMDRQPTAFGLRQAEQQYRAALEHRLDMPEIYLGLAKVLKQAGKQSESDEMYGRAFALLRERALPPYARGYFVGDESAQVAVGLFYESGVGAVSNLEYAAKWYRPAAEHGYADAQFYLGRAHEYAASGPTLYGAANAAYEALYWYQQAAEQGHIGAQFHLARLYDSGRVGQDEETEALAMQWYKRAAEHGVVPAQNNLGVMYATGKGVAGHERHEWLAGSWFREAAGRGDPAGMLNLALMYVSSQSARKNYRATRTLRAAELLLCESAALGNSGAMNQLAWLWAHRGQRLSDALRLAEAAVAGNPDNRAYRDALGWILYQMGRYSAAVKELTEAVEPHEWLRYDHLGDAYAKLDCTEHASAAWFDALEAVQRKETDAVKRNDMRAAQDMHAQSVRLQAKLIRIAPAAGNSSPAASTALPSCPV